MKLFELELKLSFLEACIKCLKEQIASSSGLSTEDVGYLYSTFNDFLLEKNEVYCSIESIKYKTSFDKTFNIKQAEAYRNSLKERVDFNNTASQKIDDSNDTVGFIKHSLELLNIAYKIDEQLFILSLTTDVNSS